LAEAVVQVLADASLFAVADLQDFLLETLALADVANDAGEETAAIAEPHLADCQIRGE
jgi:hypothetical protein